MPSTPNNPGMRYLHDGCVEQQTVRAWEVAEV